MSVIYESIQIIYFLVTRSIKGKKLLVFDYLTIVYTIHSNLDLLSIIARVSKV
jgi:hypothetical protein